MNLDVRTPAGFMFVLLGAVLALYGLVGDAAQYERSLGININLVWGAAMMFFGGALLLWRAVAPQRR